MSTNHSPAATLPALPVELFDHIFICLEASFDIRADYRLRLDTWRALSATCRRTHDLATHRLYQAFDAQQCGPQALRPFATTLCQRPELMKHLKDLRVGQLGQKPGRPPSAFQLALFESRLTDLPSSVRSVRDGPNDKIDRLRVCLRSGCCTAEAVFILMIVTGLESLTLLPPETESACNGRLCNGLASEVLLYYAAIYKASSGPTSGLTSFSVLGRVEKEVSSPLRWMVPSLKHRSMRELIVDGMTSTALSPGTLQVVKASSHVHQLRFVNGFTFETDIAQVINACAIVTDLEVHWDAPNTSTAFDPSEVTAHGFRPVSRVFDATPVIDALSRHTGSLKRLLLTDVRVASLMPPITSFPQFAALRELIIDYRLLALGDWGPSDAARPLDRSLSFALPPKLTRLVVHRHALIGPSQTLGTIARSLPESVESAEVTFSGYEDAVRYHPEEFELSFAESEGWDLRFDESGCSRLPVFSIRRKGRSFS